MVLSNRVKLPGQKDYVWDTRKSPSAGVDLLREFIDYLRDMGRSYVGHVGTLVDAQKLEQWKRATELSLLVGMVMSIKDQIHGGPDQELGQDIVATEGLRDNLAIYNQLVNLIPRDGRMDATLTTTVDPDRTNIRSMAVYKLIPGFSIFLLMLCKNNFFERPVEDRFSDVMVVAFVLYTNTVPDTDGLSRHLDAAADNFDAAEATADAAAARKTRATSNNAGARSKKKGDLPTDMGVQRRWAPFLYYVHAITRNVVAICNKMGIYTVEVNYATRHVVEFVYKTIFCNFSCFFSESDKNNASRYTLGPQL